jgi:hypothetical protein
MSAAFDYKPEDAFYGPLGSLAKRIEPFVPINSLALYCELLVAVGTIVGRRAVIRYIEDEHFSNLFLIMVGKTGVGKGTSWNIVNRIATEISDDFPSLVPTDSASAPGLIALVRDPSTRVVNGKETQDAGVADKRRLVLFEEMETLFTAMRRQGSTLDQTWRLAWAGRTLENNARTQERATNPHLSTVCQITPEAFKQAINERGHCRLTSGFINRFLIVPVTRERRIHRSSTLPDVQDLVATIRRALSSLGPVQDGLKPREITWAPEACGEWDAFCDALDDGDAFLEGVETAYGRLKPMIMRVAMLLAVIDGDSMIRLCHLRAAKALCLHLVDASRHFFSDRDSGRARTAGERLREYRPKENDFSVTDLHVWMKNRLPKDLVPPAEELHRLIDELIRTGVWVTVQRTESPRHRGWRFALAEASDHLGLPEDENRERQAEGLSQTSPGTPCAGMEEPYYLGASFQVPHLIEGLTLDNSPHVVRRGETGHIVQLRTDGTGTTFDSLLAIQKRERGYRLVCITGELLLLPAKPVLEWAKTPMADLQMA